MIIVTKGSVPFALALRLARALFAQPYAAGWRPPGAVYKPIYRVGAKPCGLRTIITSTAIARQNKKLASSPACDRAISHLSMALQRVCVGTVPADAAPRRVHRGRWVAAGVLRDRVWG